MPGRITAAEKHKRVSQVTELLLTGHSRADILRFAAEMNWDVSERQVTYYISAANEYFKKSAAVDRDSEIGKAMRRYTRLYRESYRVKDYRTAMQTQEKIVALFGLAQAASIDVNLHLSHEDQLRELE